ncbi:MAG: glycosyltransferase [Candidatus Woesebacteria bacterium]
MAKISLIITTKNETRTISTLLDSIAKQTRIPAEIILANAGPIHEISIPQQLVVRIMELPIEANRATGRNRAIEEARYDHILITDAGCRLKEDWVEKMEKGFQSADVVAGFYASDAQTVFEQCVAPYALVMPDRIDTKTFLPATRSMGITKTVFEQLGRFNEKYRYAEDYEFARRLRKQKIPVCVLPEAIVYWRPRRNLFAFAHMIFEHAFGDGYSKTFRPKVALIFCRYFLWICLLPFAIISQPFFFLYLLSIAFYLTYAVYKNYRYIDHWKALIYLPVLQVISDYAVMWGTLRGSLSAS